MEDGLIVRLGGEGDVEAIAAFNVAMGWETGGAT